MKNITLIILILFLYSCGYSSIYKNLQLKNAQIIIVDEKGDDDMNSLVKSELRLYSNKDSTNIYNLDINTEYKKEALTKNAKGVITDYTLSVTAKFTTEINGKLRTLKFKEKIDIKILPDSFEQSIFEKNIKRNFASSIREKLITAILEINDN